MYAQLLKDILLDMKRNDATKSDMIDACRKWLLENGHEDDLAIVNEFERDYNDPTLAILWYTRPTFLYTLLNKALREQDIDLLYSFRFFIKDLHEQLSVLHPDYIKTLGKTKTLTVYRGLGIFPVEFDKIKNNVGGFLSMTSFLSTSTNKEVAVGFAQHPVHGKDAVLLQMNVDVDKCKTAFVDIQDLSFYKTEAEVLFTTGTVFKIISVVQQPNGIWNVQLKLTGEEDEQLRKLTKHMKATIEVTSHPLLNLILLLRHMGQFNKVEQFCKLALQDPTITSDGLILSEVYNTLGHTYFVISSDFDRTIEIYEKGLELRIRHTSPDNPALAPTYNSLGEIYLVHGDLDRALTIFKKALHLQLNAPTPNQKQIGIYFANIGTVYLKQEHYSEALEMYEKSLKIRLQILPSTSPDIAVSYVNIGSVYYEQKDYNKAIEYYKKTLEIQLSSLPIYHLTLAITYYNLCWAHYQKGSLVEALDWMKKANEIFCKNYPSDQVDVVQSQGYIDHIAKELH
ncbi:unnamed protein product [Didymodactylos carnosus]|uniref:NAD(P)(+)--arginine ADP-ribosyltransferase n=1 Tax=Didymodactylos carnosus TaxID=1234261 RepID=A0A814AUP0_9BILA|nr:unnamed protein product [Didymodactylos carnosus]CAF3697535.1 unnamed protein product [Didymodactylos carnosus]